MPITVDLSEDFPVVEEKTSETKKGSVDLSRDFLGGNLPEEKEKVLEKKGRSVDLSKDFLLISGSNQELKKKRDQFKNTVSEGSLKFAKELAQGGVLQGKAEMQDFAEFLDRTKENTRKRKAKELEEE